MSNRAVSLRLAQANQRGDGKTDLKTLRKRYDFLQGNCVYCLQPVDWEDVSPAHRVAFAEGGDSDLWPSHLTCNQKAQTQEVEIPEYSQGCFLRIASDNYSTGVVIST